MNREPTSQLRAWEGDFGRAYTDRNVVDWHFVLPFFEKMLTGLRLDRVLEVGCNRGHNLVALAELLGAEVELLGVDPNPYAVGLARTASAKIGVLRGNAFDLPFRDQYFDLVFTSGVLMHIAPEDLPAALREIHRVTRRYILSIDYFSETDEPIHYRGHDDLLWKRNVPRCWHACFPDLTVVRTGYEEQFDRSHWWVFEKA